MEDKTDSGKAEQNLGGERTEIESQSTGLNGERFSISRHSNGYYVVSIPNYEGGEVVRAEVYDALVTERDTLREAVRIAALRLTELNEPVSPLGAIRDDLYAALSLTQPQVED